ncbi:hypothetical protein BZG02_09850 [Labilibaculum filiforme]|uniref:Uncharacterized protein n=1 Tax=Labilibaculum filiforme TaxID=1940526 RepID=A0A2N3HYD0_9BACT|nr:hypothetical protein [Labilibaculum filiforme]PKQ63062.1 hypothetical protein BZG02_09850 [Labilibaculum filiforme]
MSDGNELGANEQWILGGKTPKWIKESFADSYYYTAETMESLTVFRRFGGGANQAKLLGGFSSTDFEVFQG